MSTVGNTTTPLEGCGNTAELQQQTATLRAEVARLNAAWQATFETAAFHQEETKSLRAQLAAAEARAERLAMALIPLANAHSPAERELLTDDDSEQAQRALYGAALAEGGEKS